MPTSVRRHQVSPNPATNTFIFTPHIGGLPALLRACLASIGEGDSGGVPYSSQLSGSSDARQDLATPEVMSSYTPPIVLAFQVSVALVLLAACTSRVEAPTPLAVPPTPTTDSPTPAANRQDHSRELDEESGLPQGYELFESEAFPYSIVYPSWAMPSPAASSTDTFWIGDASRGEPAWVSTAVLPSEGITPREYLAQSGKQSAGEISVGRERALVARGSRQAGGERREYLQAVWQHGGRIWLATLDARPDELETHLPTFRAMVATLRYH